MKIVHRIIKHFVYVYMYAYMYCDDGVALGIAESREGPSKIMNRKIDTIREAKTIRDEENKTMMKTVPHD